MRITIITRLLEENIQKIKDSFPDFDFHVNHHPSQQEIDESDVLIGNPSLDLQLNRSRIQAIMLNSAGNDGYIKEGVLHPDTVLTNASGSYGIAISEHTIGMLLAYNKRFDVHFTQQQAHHWQMQTCGQELYHHTVLIVGLGDLGYAIAKRLKAFDCRIIGLKRRQSAPIPYVDQIDTIDHLKDHLPDADYVILTLPLTPATYHLFDGDTFALMKEGAVLVNVGRGQVVDEEGLLKALDGHLGAALLDVVEAEPLKSESPLWDHPRVMITSHSAGGYHWPSVQNYLTELFIRNLHHLVAHEPLENEVDRQTGYRKEVTYHE